MAEMSTYTPTPFPFERDNLHDEEETRALSKRSYECALESLVLMNQVYLRRHPDVPQIGPNARALRFPQAGKKIIVGKRSSECGCAVHSNDEVMLTLEEMMTDPRVQMLVDVEDVAAWRCAELRHGGDGIATMELREDRATGYAPKEGPRHYRVIVVRGDGVEETFDGR